MRSLASAVLTTLGLLTYPLFIEGSDSTPVIASGLCFGLGITGFFIHTFIQTND